MSPAPDARQATIVRSTKETQVECTLRLDGSGTYDVQTDNRFLTHMVETWARYAGFDVRLRATGDLDHHLVEDVAICLGQAFRQAFAHAPCVRISYDFVPMDDALVLCAVDLKAAVAAIPQPPYRAKRPTPVDPDDEFDEEAEEGPTDSKGFIQVLRAREEVLAEPGMEPDPDADEDVA